LFIAKGLKSENWSLILSELSLNPMFGNGVGFRHSVSEFLPRIHVDYVKELLPSNKISMADISEKIPAHALKGIKKCYRAG
jgi:hypothetical protein